MSTKKIAVTISILTIWVIALFICPSINQSVNADQSNSTVVGLDNAYRITAESNAVLNHYFGKDVEKTLKQPGCAEVRMYYGKQKDGSSKLIIIGVDKNGKDVAPIALIPRTLPCPPNCTGPV
jgi:hypothetical protein